MGKSARAGLVLMWAVASIGGSAGTALAQAKELSDKSVLTLMDYAWTLVPSKFTSPQGKVIEVDKKRPSDNIVPMETAREVIRVARLSAIAQICELMEEQVANYQTLMRREEAKKWTDQQMLFINQLHLFTVMMWTGKVQLVEHDGDKRIVPQESKPARTESCTDTERKKVKDQILAYVNANPPPPAAATASPAKRAEPTPTSQKK